MACSSLLRYKVSKWLVREWITLHTFAAWAVATMMALAAFLLAELSPAWPPFAEIQHACRSKLVPTATSSCPSFSISWKHQIIFFCIVSAGVHSSWLPSLVQTPLAAWRVWCIKHISMKELKLRSVKVKDPFLSGLLGSSPSRSSWSLVWLLFTSKSSSAIRSSRSSSTSAARVWLIDGFSVNKLLD